MQTSTRAPSLGIARAPSRPTPQPSSWKDSSKSEPAASFAPAIEQGAGNDVEEFSLRICALFPGKSEQHLTKVPPERHHVESFVSPCSVCSRIKQWRANVRLTTNCVGGCVEPTSVPSQTHGGTHAYEQVATMLREFQRNAEHGGASAGQKSAPDGVRPTPYTIHPESKPEKRLQKCVLVFSSA